MELIRVDEKEFDKYVLNSSKPHYLQTSVWGEVNKKRGITTHLLQLKNDNKIIGSAMLIEKKILCYRTFYCPRGFICDYDNKEDIKNMVTYLLEYVKKHNGLYLKIDPDIIIRKLDSNCKPIYENSKNIELIKYIESLGGKHRGFTVKFSESSMPRFTFRVDITKDNLIETFHQTTRNLLKRNNPYNLKITIGDKDGVNKFYKIMQETAKRKNMYLENIEFFESFYDVLHNQQMSDVYVVSVNIDELKQKYSNQIKDIENQLTTPNLKKGAITDLNDQLKKYQKEYKQIECITEKEVILSSMLTAKYKDIVWTIHGANANELSFLNANYELYYQIIKDAKQQGYKWVDFYGSEGSVDKNSDAFGIFNFKVRFGGDFDEFIGEFDFVTKPLMNSIISFLLKLRRKIKYNLQKR